MYCPRQLKAIGASLRLHKPRPANSPLSGLKQCRTPGLSSPRDATNHFQCCLRAIHTTPPLMNLANLYSLRESVLKPFSGKMVLSMVADFIKLDNFIHFGLGCCPISRGQTSGLSPGLRSTPPEKSFSACPLSRERYPQIQCLSTVHLDF